MSTRVTRRPAWVLLFLAVAGVVPVLRSLRAADLNWCYPFMTGDSYDWINNGLYWAGAPVSPSLRPPGLPLVIAALWKLGALPLLPVINFLFLGLTTAALYALLRERHDGWIAATACWFFFAASYVQDFSRYIMAETYALPFLVLAALAFVRADRAPRAWIAFGLCIGASFLFAYAAAPAAVGFGVAVLAKSRRDLRRKELWAGVTVAALTVGGWAIFRWLFYRSHSGQRHLVETLLRPTFANLGFYLFDAIALMGLVPLALYLAGAFGFARDGPPARLRAAVLGPLVVLSFFFGVVYDWVDKRFLLYVFPFLVVFLAEGLSLLRGFARRGRGRAVLAAVFFGAAVLWNQIRYPSYGIQYLALTPRRFLAATATMTPAYKSELHVKGSRVVLLHETLPAAFAGGLFDWHLAASACVPGGPDPRCLAEMTVEADRLLGPGEPIGLLTPRAWPDNYYIATNRLSNILLRPVVLPDLARVTLAGVESPAPPLARCGPYALVRSR